MLSVLKFLLTLLSFAACEIPGDLIEKIPGFSGPLPTRHWSGYIGVKTANGTAQMHYWLVENSAKSPTAPTVVWQQGGPGGSSLIGLFTEMGPLTLNDQSYLTKEYNETGIPTVFLNENSWHNAPANFLFVEHPAPTGFSYCEGDCYWDDHTQSEINYQFYVQFFSKAYPELASNDFYFTGESYAGVLVPTVALEILKHRSEQNADKAPWNLKGFALGNDCPGNRIFTCTPYSGWIGTQVALDFRYGHGMIKDSTYNLINKVCAGQWGTYEAPSKQCRDLLEDPVRPVMSEAGDTYDMGGGYFLYDTCGHDLLRLHGDGLPHPEREEQRHMLKFNSTYPLNSGEYACGQERASTEWLNIPAVQKAIHVKLIGKKQFHFSTGLNYTFTAYSLLDEYKEKLIPNFRIMQYSGDADPCVPYVGTQRWIDSLNLSVSENWHPWRFNSQVAGYVTTYTTNNFTFATIRDAGHMVPRYKPKATFQMFKRWLNNQKL